jgi:Ca2+-binding EF-hand superfamily protein
LDGSGTIDRNELQGLIFELGEVMTQEEVNAIFNSIDTGILLFIDFLLLLFLLNIFICYLGKIVQ